MDALMFEAHGQRATGNGQRATGNRLNSNPPLARAFFILFAALASMTMVKPAHASGTVAFIQNYYYTAYYSQQAQYAYCHGSAPAVAACWVAAAHSDPQYSYGYDVVQTGLTGTSPGIMTIAATWYSYVGCTSSICHQWSGNIYTFGPATSSTSCPANSTPTGSACTCNDASASNPINYVPGPDGKSCIQEALTIALYGLGVVLQPTKPLTTAYAKVTKSDGSPKSGAQVKLIYTVELKSGGPVRAENIGSLSPNGGSTDAYGKLSFEFKAPTAGGITTITASCIPNCANIYDQGTITVPECQIPPLTPLTDPVAIDFDNSVGGRWRPDGLTPAFQEHLACVEAAIDKATGVRESYTGTSAYRPYQYQRHLYEVIKKDVKLKPSYMLAHPECQTLRDEITHEMSADSGSPPGHDLKYNQKVATPSTSNHESGTAFDLTPHGLTKAQMAPIYATCGVRNTKVKGEPWHVQ